MVYDRGSLGAAVGWILRGYDLTAVVVFGVRFAVEFPLLTVVPEIDRYLPAGSLVAPTGAPIPGPEL